MFDLREQESGGVATLELRLQEDGESLALCKVISNICSRNLLISLVCSAFKVSISFSLLWIFFSQISNFFSNFITTLCRSPFVAAVGHLG